MGIGGTGGGGLTKSGNQWSPRAHHCQFIIIAHILSWQSNKGDEASLRMRGTQAPQLQPQPMRSISHPKPRAKPKRCSWSAEVGRPSHSCGGSGVCPAFSFRQNAPNFSPLKDPTTAGLMQPFGMHLAKPLP